MIVNFLFVRRHKTVFEKKRVIKLNTQIKMFHLNSALLNTEKSHVEKNESHL